MKARSFNQVKAREAGRRVAMVGKAHKTCFKRKFQP